MMELKHIGRYDIKSLIGQGGMSAVYLGYDPRALREVAIKILPPYYLHAPKFRERFEREAVMIALLEHPAIVPVYDMGEEDGQPYIVMRYMSGGSLAEKLKRGAIPLRECTDMYLRLAPALDTAHARGVTHRDVKPDNLLFDKYDNVFLSDFGLARLRETIGFANISDGSILGTPAYMSPEQIQGDRQIDGRSDIYSMGVVLYQMLCGVVPYDGTTAASVMMMHLVNPVPQIHDTNPTLPLAIQAVLEKSMAKNPEDRYRTAMDFAKAIQAVSSGAFKRSEVRPVAVPTLKPTEKQAPENRPSREIIVSSAEPDALPAEPEPSNGSDLPTLFDSLKSRLASPKATNVFLPVEKERVPATPSPSATLAHKRLAFPMWGWVASAVLVVLLSLTVIQWTRGGFPFSILPGSGSSPEARSGLVLGQADKLAFVKDAEIWVSNLDGSGLAQLTSDSKPKSNLHWSPDGQSIIYTSANCISSVDLETQRPQIRTCFSGVQTIGAFDISPDGRNVALGLAASDLYLLPYAQLLNLRPTSFPEDLLAIAKCSFYAPYRLDDQLKAAKWSASNDQLALLVSTPMDGVSRDAIHVMDFSQCSASPTLVNEILPTTFLFTLRGYYNRPEISGFAWGQNNQILLNGYLNDAGYGDLQLFDLNKNRTIELAPQGKCCYQDAFWSPDGTYLFFAFQPEAGGEVSLYYAPYSPSQQPGGSITAVALPAGFLATGSESLQPALRTVH